jgi:hypothetical protein
MGWYAIRHEIRKLMTAFLILGFIFVFGWAFMFYSTVYRWTFLEWPFLACLTLESLIVLTSSLVLGVIAWFNFNKGLANYLYAEDKLSVTTMEPEVFPQDLEGGSVKDVKLFLPDHH